MFIRLLRPTLLLAAAAGLAACSSHGDRGYGYSRVSLGVGSASPYYGWYDGYYYPGTGYYVYDRRGTRHRWGDRQRHYWEGRRGPGRRYDNWSGYRDRRDGDGRQWGGDRRDWDRDDRRRTRDDRRADDRGERNDDRNEWRRRGNRERD